MSDSDSPLHNSEETPAGTGLPRVSPDLIEQDHGDEFDDIVPTRGYQMTPMVGLGGSAGGSPALRQFFRAMSADSGMIFVVVLHLSPEHESLLPELIARETGMPVRLQRYFEQERRVKMPSEEGPQPAQVASLRTEDERETALREILSFRAIRRRRTSAVTSIPELATNAAAFANGRPIFGRKCGPARKASERRKTRTCNCASGWRRSISWRTQ